MMQLNTDTYYRLLNWGLRLAAGLGSATGAKPAPVGYNRTYVRVKADSTLDEFNTAWKAGRNFVTNGPILIQRTRDGHYSGDTINLPPGGGTMHLEVEAVADQRLSTIEIIVNGRVTESLKVDDPDRVKSRVNQHQTRLMDCRTMHGA
jgi:hypothetical protein